jgi:hypothetical protein
MTLLDDLRAFVDETRAALARLAVEPAATR